ncbi:MAG: flagellar basal body rod protein FlgB [Bacillota bacterium]
MLQVLEKQLDAAALTQKVVANNLANVNTPGFKKSSVRFLDELKKALDSRALPLLTTHPRHLPSTVPLTQVAPIVVKEEETTMGYNQNNVDVEQEMVNLAANTLAYQAATRAIGDRLALLGYVIRGR